MLKDFYVCEIKYYGYYMKQNRISDLRHNIYSRPLKKENVLKKKFVWLYLHYRKFEDVCLGSNLDTCKEIAVAYLDIC